MSISVLSQASALNPGADLWIVPDLERSHWTQQLDWYLNFQICKASRHVRPRLPDFVESVIAQTELVLTKLPQTSPQLMIASENLLPNRWIIVMPWSEDLKAWTSESFKAWQQLKQPTLRVFLPPGQSTGAFQSMWESHHTSQDFTVVLD